MNENRDSLEDLFDREEKKYLLSRSNKKIFTNIFYIAAQILDLFIGIITSLKRIDLKIGFLYVLFVVLILSAFLGGGKVDGYFSLRGATFKTYRFSSFLISCYLVFGIGFGFGYLYILIF